MGQFSERVDEVRPDALIVSDIDRMGRAYSGSQRTLEFNPLLRTGKARHAIPSGS
jgi:hypothetical protein